MVGEGVHTDFKTWSFETYLHIYNPRMFFFIRFVFLYPFDITEILGGIKTLKLFKKNIKKQPMRYSEKISLILPFTD